MTNQKFSSENPASIGPAEREHPTPIVELLMGNQRYVKARAENKLRELLGETNVKTVIVTCMDGRIEPSVDKVFDLQDSPAVIRIAGAQVSDEILTDVVTGALKFEADVVVVMAHTDCAMHTTRATLLEHLEEIFRRITNAIGARLDWMEDRTISDPAQRLQRDVDKIQKELGADSGKIVVGMEYNLKSGAVEVKALPPHLRRAQPSAPTLKR